MANALKWIIKEAKSLRRKYPHRFREWKQYVAQASAIYASKHKGRSPVGKKRRHSSPRRTKAVSTRRKTHTHSSRPVNIKTESIAQHKSAIRTQLKDRLGKKLVSRMMAKKKRTKRQLTKQIQNISTDLRRYQ